LSLKDSIKSFSISANFASDRFLIGFLLMGITLLIIRCPYDLHLEKLSQKHKVKVQGVGTIAETH